MISPVISQSQANRKATAQIQTDSVPSPIGGLNARDSIANMPPTDAIILDNWFCTPSDVVLRNGYISWSTGYNGWVETIMAYNGKTGTRQLFGIAGGTVAESSLQGSNVNVGISGLANSRFQSINFATAGGTYLYAVNGADNPLLYDGSAWQQVSNISAPIAITGTDPSKFISVNLFAQRLYFVPINSTGFYYLPPASVGGAASFFDLGSLMRLGGYLMGMATWTIDNAAGIQEYAVFVTSEGEVMVYQGIDPTSTSTWAKVAQFRIGRPIGRRFYEKNGSDLILLTADGAVRLSESLLTDRQQDKTAISDKIKNLINSDVKAYNGNFGWQAILYPIGNKLIINVPVAENSIQYQYVMNTITGAWSSFGKMNSPWSATCFCIWEDQLYFGGQNFIAQCDTGQDDNGGNIQASAKQAFNYFGVRGQQKYFTMIRPVLISNGQLQAAIDLNVNFEDRQPTSTPSFSGAGGTAWNTGLWNVSPWQQGQNVVQDWDTPNAIGFCAALYMKVSAANQGVSWECTDFVFQPGGVL